MPLTSCRVCNFLQDDGIFDVRIFAMDPDCEKCFLDTSCAMDTCLFKNEKALWRIIYKYLLYVFPEP